MNKDMRFLEVERRLLEEEDKPLVAMREMLTIHARANEDRTGDR